MSSENKYKTFKILKKKSIYVWIPLIVILIYWYSNYIFYKYYYINFERNEPMYYKLVEEIEKFECELEEKDKREENLKEYSYNECKNKSNTIDKLIKDLWIDDIFTNWYYITIYPKTYIFIRWMEYYNYNSWYYEALNMDDYKSKLKYYNWYYYIKKKYNDDWVLERQKY